jgi:hypothetical protein
MPELKYGLKTSTLYRFEFSRIVFQVTMAPSVNNMDSPFNETSILNGQLYSCKTKWNIYDIFGHWHHIVMCWFAIVSEGLTIKMETLSEMSSDKPTISQYHDPKISTILLFKPRLTVNTNAPTFIKYPNIMCCSNSGAWEGCM